MQEKSIYTFGNSFIILSFIVAICYLGYVPVQSDGVRILVPYFIAFTSAIYLVKISRNEQVLPLIILGLGLRFILIFAFPNLSDDIYRFMWDGALIQDGINPYRHLPSEIFRLASSSLEPYQSLFTQLNSPEYFTIYPPVCQMIFYSGKVIAGQSIETFSMCLKVIFFLFECGSIWIIYRLVLIMNMAKGNVLLYALNPLIILELSGNLHFEAIMVFFVLLSFYLLIKNHLFYSALSLAIGIGTKLLPLIFVPLILIYLGKKNGLKYTVILSLALVLIGTPIWWGLEIAGFVNSLDLYFRSFEFNASIYYLLRAVGYYFTGWNLIAYLGPGLALIALLCMTRIWKRYTIQPLLKNLPAYSLIVFTVYLMFTTTVHPWYLALPIALCCLTELRYPILWSLLIFGTYLNYSYDPYMENLWVVAIEYLILLGYLVYIRRFGQFRIL